MGFAVLSNLKVVELGNLVSAPFCSKMLGFMGAEVIKIENFKNEPCELRLIEYIPGEWEMIKTTEKYEKENNEKIIFTISLDAKEKREFKISYLKKNIR